MTYTHVRFEPPSPIQEKGHPEFGLKEGFCILSLDPCKITRKTMAYIKHRFKSIQGAVRRLRQVERTRDWYMSYSENAAYRLKMVARLAADTPQFSNPLHVIEAKKIRDEILRGDVCNANPN